ncbi:type II toxin-antitoxin system YafQ family toxin [Bacteroides acidifaciens]|uniref:type II toxin-antitoxin system YafQ family toxin n=1 Tax=Bacteroides acidifaciens TaxID=85831 RepID=UPI0023D40FE3|nr:type II toxin-antitoxin system YafQ family toxin [Bacteroides acidifaciens]MDE6094822.1 type II toxin-antitoxin system YafQ family toxin [Muribaculaceae bacterium]
MKELKPTSQYKKDYKRFRNNPKKLEKLFDILELLRQEKPIPEENRPHPLTGDYAGHMECHIEGDFLLIWFDPHSDVISLVRLGSHSELFG